MRDDMPKPKADYADIEKRAMFMMLYGAGNKRIGALLSAWQGRFAVNVASSTLGTCIAIGVCKLAGVL